MNEISTNSKCLEFSPYLYDYLFGAKGDIPESAFDHISSCENCKAEMELLGRELKKCEESTDSILQTAKSENLKLHYTYIGRNVGCMEVKPFIAAMCSGDFDIEIPTPITVHINHCKSCQSDIDRLRSLELPKVILHQVGQAFACGSSVLSAVLDNLNCDESTTKEIISISERPDSGINTLFTLKDEATDQICNSSENIYDDWQVDVKILTGTEALEVDLPGQSAAEIKESQVSKVRPSRFSFGKLIKPIAAAAVITVVFLIFSGPSATADLDLVFKALENIKNVHIKTVSPVNGDVVQEAWISRDLNVKLFKTGSQITLWDIGNKEYHSIDAVNNSMETQKLDPDSITLVSSTMQVPWSLFPSNDASNLPAGSTMQVLSNTGAGTKIFELQWADPTPEGIDVAKKWKGFIDSKTHLPGKVEWWRKFAGDEEYELITVIEISYPDTGQIRTVIEGIQSNPKLLSLP